MNILKINSALLRLKRVWITIKFAWYLDISLRLLNLFNAEHGSIYSKQSLSNTEHEFIGPIFTPLF